MSATAPSCFWRAVASFIHATVPTEAFLDKVDGARSLDQIVVLLCDEFEVDKDTLDQDMAALAADLVSEGILADPGA